MFTFVLLVVVVCSVYSFYLGVRYASRPEAEKIESKVKSKIDDIRNSIRDFYNRVSK